MNNERLVWHEKHVFPAEETRYRNPMFPKQSGHSSLITRTAVALCIIALLAGIGYVSFASPFRIVYVTVEGNHFLRYDEMNNLMQNVLQKKILGVLPRDSFVFFSPAYAQSYIKKGLEQQQAVESLTVAKKFPDLVSITVKERIPNAVYMNGGSAYLLDRSGVIVAKVEDGKKTDPSFPTLYDQTTRDIAVGKPVAHPDIINFLFSTLQLLKDRTDIQIATVYMPLVYCPTQATTPTDTEEFLREQAVNAASNTNASPEEGSSNTNASTSLNVNTTGTFAMNSNTNNSVNTSAVNGKIAANLNTNAEPLQPACDLNSQVQKNLELHIKTAEKWELYLRIDDSAENQISRLLKLLQTQKIDRTALHYIDLRFGDQVIYR